MFRLRSRTVNLHEELSQALCAGRVNRALDIYELLEQRNPDEPRWSHRKGEVLKRMGRDADAAESYERSVELYAAKGFVARAAAMAKMILAIDPRRVGVLEQTHRAYPYDIDLLVAVPDFRTTQFQGAKLSHETDEARVTNFFLGDIRVEIERVPVHTLLDVEHLSRSPSVYKPVMLSDWRRPGRRLVSIGQSMMEWPKLSGREAFRWAMRSVRSSLRARKLARELPRLPGPE